MNYLVLGGGTSPEKRVSERSATELKSALEQLGHTVTYLDPANHAVADIVTAAVSVDAVFPIIHGAGGEDGVLQAALEAAGIAYFGPTPNACAVTFDKVVFKRLLEAEGIATPDWNVVSAGSFASEPLTQRPFVLKPIGGGSSIDTFIIRLADYDRAPLLEALNRYENMLIEEYIEGSEITVGVLEDTALPVVEIIPPENQEFDYENKYNGATQELCPPQNVTLQLQNDAQAIALEVHRITQCGHISRTDLLINGEGQLFVIDTNTIPGLTNQSLYPKAAATAGLDWLALVKRFTELVK